MEATAPSSTIASERPGSAPAQPRRGHRARVRRATDAVLIGLFLVGIFAPLIGVKLGRHGWDVAERAENRRMVTEPSLLRLNELHIHSAKGRLKALAKF